MKRRHLIFILLVFVAVPSCNIPSNAPSATETPPLPSQPTVDIPITGVTGAVNTPTQEVAATQVELEFPTATATSTPTMVLATPRDQPVNCRFGPDVSYAAVGALIVGRQAEVIGKNIDITWIYVRNPSDPSTSCWLSVDVVNIVGNVLLLPVVGPPEIMVTTIKVSIDPPAMNVACSAFPQIVAISADITTNGPLIVNWYCESSTGKTSDQKQILFEAGETKTVHDYYQVDQSGDYTIDVRSVPPNSQVGEATFKVICTP